MVSLAALFAVWFTAQELMSGVAPAAHRRASQTGHRARDAALSRAAHTFRARQLDVARNGGSLDRPAREQDSTTTDLASTWVEGSIVLPDGEAIDSGTLSVYCEQDPGYILSDRASLGEDGRFRAQGCRGASCWALSSAIASGGPWHWDRDPQDQVELEVSAGTTLNVRVEDEEGHPIVDANVLLTGSKDERTATLTDDGGLFSLRFPGSRLGQGADLVSCPPDARGGASSNNAEIPDAAAAESALAEAGHLSPETQVGALAIEPHQGLAVGHARLELRAPGFEPLEIDVDHREAPATLVMRRETRDLEVEGRVLGSEGRVFARARVLARSQEDAKEQLIAAIDESGHFAFSALRDTIYDLFVIHDGVVLATRSARGGDKLEIVTEVAAAGCTIELVFLGTSGMPATPSVLRGGPFSPAARTSTSYAGRETNVVALTDHQRDDPLADAAASSPSLPRFSQVAHGVIGGRYRVRAYFEESGWHDASFEVDAHSCASSRTTSTVVTVVVL